MKPERWTLILTLPNDWQNTSMISRRLIILFTSCSTFNMRVLSIIISAWNIPDIWWSCGCFYEWSATIWLSRLGLGLDTACNASCLKCFGKFSFFYVSAAPVDPSCRPGGRSGINGNSRGLIGCHIPVVTTLGRNFVGTTEVSIVFPPSMRSFTF